MRRPGDVVAGGLLTLLGVGVSVRAVGLEIGSALDPQPGFFPFIGGLLLTVLAIILAVQGFRGASASGEGERDDLRKPLVLVVALLVYAALLETVGYPIMTVLIVLVVLRTLEARWVPGVAVSILLSLGSYLLFVKLGVPLPPGRLFGS
jgi:putative tricarboxylic transport membrane protein